LAELEILKYLSSFPYWAESIHVSLR